MGIDAEMLREVGWSPEESPHAFVCGPTPARGGGGVRAGQPWARPRA